MFSKLRAAVRRSKATESTERPPVPKSPESPRAVRLVRPTPNSVAPYSVYWSDGFNSNLYRANFSEDVWFHQVDCANLATARDTIQRLAASPEHSYPGSDSVFRVYDNSRQCFVSHPSLGNIIH